MKIAIYGQKFGNNFQDAVSTLFAVLAHYQADICIHKSFYDFLVQKVGFKPAVNSYFTGHNNLPDDTDLLISMGGDGTFLQAVLLVREKGIPIVGLNTGRLGFLSNIAKEEIQSAMEDILQQKYTYESRSLLQLDTPNQLFGSFNYALNEATIHKKDSSSMITIHTYINDEYLNTYWADGLIISTPTGSTAYSLSAGGPIVIPSSANFIITPLAPHNLTVRPLVVPDNITMRFQVEGRSSHFLASLDSRSASFDSSIELTVKKADFSIKLIKLERYGFFSTLRNKLMWGVDRRN